MVKLDLEKLIQCKDFNISKIHKLKELFQDLFKIFLQLLKKKKIEILNKINKFKLEHHICKFITMLFEI